MATTTDTTTEMTVEQLAEERTAILRLTDTPHLTNDHGDIRIAPYSVWITYRKNAGEQEHTWHANVSGHRVLWNGVVDFDGTSISLWTGDDIPEWLAELIADHTPSW